MKVSKDRSDQYDASFLNENKYTEERSGRRILYLYYFALINV